MYGKRNKKNIYGSNNEKPSINGFIDDSLAKIALLFDQLKNRIITLKLAIQSSKRSMIGKNTMDFVLTEDGRTIVAQIQKVMQKIRDNYKPVISIDSVNVQDAQPPEQVQASFEDAIKALEDKQRLVNEAEAYKQRVMATVTDNTAGLINRVKLICLPAYGS